MTGKAGGGFRRAPRHLDCHDGLWPPSLGHTGLARTSWPTVTWMPGPGVGRVRPLSPGAGLRRPIST